PDNPRRPRPKICAPVLTFQCRSNPQRARHSSGLEACSITRAASHLAVQHVRRNEIWTLERCCEDRSRLLSPKSCRFVPHLDDFPGRNQTFAGKVLKDRPARQAKIDGVLLRFPPRPIFQTAPWDEAFCLKPPRITLNPPRTSQQPS